MNIFRSTFFYCAFGKYRWYRKWYGGRWERHRIDICGGLIWLSMHPDRKWPEYRQPCSQGTPEIEDYPEKQRSQAQQKGPV